MKGAQGFHLALRVFCDLSIGKVTASCAESIKIKAMQRRDRMR